MLIAGLLILTAGFFWFLVGVVFSRIPNTNAAYSAFMLTGSVAYALFAWIMLLIQIQMGKAALIQTPELLKLSVVMIAAGVISLSGFFAMKKAMTFGYHGIAWCAAQSALILPFIAGILFLDGKKSLLQMCGVAIVLCGLAALGGVQQGGNSQQEEQTERKDKKKFIFWAAASLILIGLAQTLTIIPDSPLMPCSPEALNWRLPLFTISGLFWGFALFGKAALPWKITWHIAILYAFVGFFGNFIFYIALTKLNEMKLAAIAYPIGTGTCIALFFLYCSWFRKEKLGLCGIAGVVLVSIGILMQML